MVVSLYTSRVILEVLGVTDFGIYNVVAGVVIMIGFFQSSLANAAQRYLSISIGKGDKEGTRNVYSQCFTIMLSFSIFVLIVGETFGFWFVKTKLVIPEERMTAALWIYQFSLLSIFFSLINVTAIANIISRERMNIYAYLGLFEAFSKLAIVYLLLATSFDKLIVYGLLLSVLTIIYFVIYNGYCLKKFEEANWKLTWDKGLVKDMFKFIGFNLFGCFAYSGAEQGISIVMNMFFGPVVNAARGISTQVVGVVNRFSDSIMTAFKPQIIKSYASDDKAYMFFLIDKSSRFSFFLASLISFPIIANIDIVLQLWLGTVPEYTSQFTIIVLVETLLAMLISPLWIAANATGVIIYNQVYGRIITLLSLPLAYISLLIIKNPNAAMTWLAITQFFYWLYSVYDMHRQIQLNIARYLKNVVFPCAILSLVMTGVVVLKNMFYKTDSFIPALISVCFMGVFCAIVIFVLMDQKEKQLALGYIQKLLKKRYTKV